MARSSAEFYEWLIRVTNLIRAQQDPEDGEPFELFVRELGEVLSFDTLSKFDATSATFHWYAGPGFEKLGEELKKNLCGERRTEYRRSSDPRRLGVRSSGNDCFRNPG
jgi:hypothetical protein